MRELPFPPEGGLAAPSTPSGPKARGVYITVDRVIKFKETPGCKGCIGTSSKHTQESRDRFSRLVQAEKEEEISHREGDAESAPDAAPSAPPEAVADEKIDDLFASEGISAAPPESASASALLAQQLKGMIVSGVALSPHTSCVTPIIELCKDDPPAFGHLGIAACPAPTRNQPFVKSRKSNGANRRKRKADQKSKVPGPRSTGFEFACSPDSQMDQTNEELGINHVRLCKERINLCDPACCGQLDYQSRAAAESAPPHLWSASDCTSASAWQHLNLAKRGERFKVHLGKLILRSKKSFKSFTQRAELVLSLGGTVTFEWPRFNSGWNRPDVRRFFEQHPEFKPVEFDGCAVGLRSKNNVPVKKPWKLMTTDPGIASAFEGMRCKHQPNEHEKCEGAETSRSVFYPQQMTILIAKTWFPEKFVNNSPAMPCGVVSSSSEHREKEQSLKHVSPLSGLEDFAVELESDPTAKQIVGQLLDVNALLADSMKLEHPWISCRYPSISHEATFSNRDACQPRSRVSGSEGSWRPCQCWYMGSKLCAGASRCALRGQENRHQRPLWTIDDHCGNASIKFYELAAHLQKMKGRIVYRGDCAKDEHGSAAVYQELGANPTSVQVLKACIAYGSLPGNSTSAADAIKSVRPSLSERKAQNVDWATTRASAVVVEDQIR